jgi:hypothetical protein
LIPKRPGFYYLAKSPRVQALAIRRRTEQISRRRLFVIDGRKALRAAIDAVYGEHNPIGRCRLARRLGQGVHREPVGLAGATAPMLVQHERDRFAARGGAQ